MTVFSRSINQAKEMPDGVKLIQVDYSSIDSLVAGLRGQDAVVSTVGAPALGGQKVVIDSCIKAGVKRYIPCDWGAITTDPAAESLPINAISVDIQRYLKQKAQSGELEYTVFAVGPFLDYLISVPFAVDFQNHTVDLYDNGVHPFSTTSVSSIGKAVAGALKNASATRNRVVHIHDIVLTQGKILALAKKYSAPGVKWTENAVDASKEFNKTLEDIERKGLDFQKSIVLLKAALFSGKFAAEYKVVDNDLVGLPTLSNSEFEKIFAANIHSILLGKEELKGKFDI